MWDIRRGIANTGWFNTTVTEHAKKNDICMPVTARITAAGQFGLELSLPRTPHA